METPMHPAYYLFGLCLFGFTLWGVDTYRDYKASMRAPKGWDKIES